MVNVFMKECEIVIQDCMVPNAEGGRIHVFVIKMNMKLQLRTRACLKKYIKSY